MAFGDFAVTFDYLVHVRFWMSIFGIWLPILGIWSGHLEGLCSGRVGQTQNGWQSKGRTAKHCKDTVNKRSMRLIPLFRPPQLSSTTRTLRPISCHFTYLQYEWGAGDTQHQDHGPTLTPKTPCRGTSVRWPRVQMLPWHQNMHELFQNKLN